MKILKLIKKSKPTQIYPPWQTELPKLRAQVKKHKKDAFAFDNNFNWESVELELFLKEDKGWLYFLYWDVGDDFNFLVKLGMTRNPSVERYLKRRYLPNNWRIIILLKVSQSVGAMEKCFIKYFGKRFRKSKQGLEWFFVPKTFIDCGKLAREIPKLPAPLCVLAMKEQREKDIKAYRYGTKVDISKNLRFEFKEHFHDKYKI